MTVAVLNSDETPYCVSSDDPSLRSVLESEWPHADVLDVCPRGSWALHAELLPLFLGGPQVSNTAMAAFRLTMVGPMPRLIHLNGLSRVGKSTLARRYVDEHPGTLALDLDVLAGLVGGWREDFSSAFGIARSHGRALATRHLREGYDVVLPQLVTSHDRGPGFEDAAREAGAAYIEVALLVGDREHLHRLRGKQPANEVEARIQTMLEDPDSDLVDRIRRHLAEYLAARPRTIRLDTTGLGEDASYRALLTALAAR